MKSNYKRLGDYIRELKTRNSGGTVSELLGINIDKHFMPSVANVVGTDLTKYKVVKKNQFACNRMHVGRDYRIPIVMSESETDFIVSPAYDVFEIIDTKVLLPEYLMMWFGRAEFDRNAWFYTDSDVRGGLSWDAFCNFKLPIPDITQQQALVDEYQTIERRIKLNEQLCQKLEETAQALYRKYFVEDIEPEDLPEGWRWGKIGEYCLEMKSGGTPSRLNNEYWNKKDYRWLKTGEVRNNIVFDTEEYISKEGMINSSAKLIPINTVVMAMYGATAAQICFLKCETTTNQACCNMICDTKDEAAFLFFHLLFNQDEIKNLAIGGAQENLSQEMIAEFPIIISDKTNTVFLQILEQLELFEEQNIKLKELLSLLLAKMGRKEER